MIYWFFVCLFFVVVIVLMVRMAPNDPQECANCGLNDFTHEPSGSYCCPVCKRRAD